MNRGNISEAQKIFIKLSENSSRPEYQIKAIRQLADINETVLRDYPKSIYWHQRLVEEFRREDKYTDEVLKSVTKAGEISLKKQKDLTSVVSGYEGAILGVPNFSNKQRAEIRYLIADAYFYFNDFHQAGIEAQKVFGMGKKKNFHEKAALLIARVGYLENRFDDTRRYLEANISRFKYRKNRLEAEYLLAQTYEEAALFDKALIVLRRIHNEYPNPDVIGYSIKKISKRKKNEARVR